MEIDSHSHEPPQSRAALIVGLYAVLAVAAVLIGAARGDPNVFRLNGEWELWKLAVSPLVGLGVGLAVVFLTRLAVHQFAWARHLHQAFRGLLGALSPKDILVLALASSVGEELLFRGALLPWIGLLPSTAIFALLHIGPGLRFLPWTVSAFAMGLAFGGLYLWLGDLGAPIVAHFTINYLNLGYIVRVELPS